MCIRITLRTKLQECPYNLNLPLLCCSTEAVLHQFSFNISFLFDYMCNDLTVTFLDS
jgi:hypothetical protein